jgi:hypothetical protein
MPSLSNVPSDAGTPLLGRDGSDAHLRMAVHLAWRAAPSTARDEALQARTPWSKRRAHALQLAESHQNMVLIDPDALWVDPPPTGSGFDDGTQLRQRHAFFRELFDLAQRRNWRLVRHGRRPALSELLDRMQPALAPPTLVTDEQHLASISPALQPLARWLVVTGRATNDRLSSLIDASESPDDTVVEAFCGAIGPEALRALRHLSLLREDLPWNGVVGPFQRGGEAPLSLPERALQKLSAAGALLVNEPVSGRFYIPEPLRQRVAIRATLVDPSATTALRTRIARQLQSGGRLCELLEAHRQAVLSTNLELSESTTRFYGSDLASAARALSQRAAAEATDSGRRALYKQAADLYQQIFDRYDDEDAYAWHYFAYNLERSAKPGPLPDDVAGKVRGAYGKATALTDQSAYNPLFHGRRLAFDLAQGKPTVAVFNDLREQLRLTRIHYDPSAASWLVEQVRKRVNRGAAEQKEAWRALCSTMPWIEGLRAPAKATVRSLPEV